MLPLLRTQKINLTMGCIDTLKVDQALGSGNKPNLRVVFCINRRTMRAVGTAKYTDGVEISAISVKISRPIP